MSSKAKPRRLIRSGAFLVGALILAGSFPAYAAPDNEAEDWIQETGYGQSSSGASRAKRIADDILRESEKKTQALKQEQENTIEIPEESAENSNDGKRVAQVLPHVPASANTSAAAQTGAAIQPANASSSSGSVPLLKGEVTYCVPKGTPLKLKLATVPMPQLKMDMKDEEGNYRPAQMGEKITARITEDIYVDDNKVIPEGTEFIGKVSKIAPPRHVGRPGHLELTFDRFTTPDGRSFAFKAEANNFRPSTLKSKVQGAGRLAAYGAGGAALGALVAYKMFGMQNTVAMHGYNIAGGAAIGCTGGIGYALWKRGAQAVLEPGDEFSMSIDTDMLIPAATKPTVKAPPPQIHGFEMEVLSKKVIKDGFGGHMIRLEAFFTNTSNKHLKSIDMFLEDDLGNRFPVSPDVDDDAQQVFFISPLSQQKIVVTFSVEHPKLKHKVVWIDHHDHHVIFEQKI